MRKENLMKKLIAVLALSVLVALPAQAQTNTPTDLTKPTISGVTVSGISSSSATVTWTTNEPATSYVDFGPSDVYGNTLGDGQYLTTHTVNVLGLTPSTLYHFRVRSKDAAGNESTSTDTTLTTTGATNANTAVNANTNKNTNTAVNTNSNTNTVKANTNTANKNTNLNKNVNTNKNTNANKNTNTTNANSNVNSGTDLFNQNTNTTTEDVTNLNENINDNTNTVTTDESNGDGRTGILLIVLGLVVLVGVVGFAWFKLRQPQGPQV